MPLPSLHTLPDIPWWTAAAFLRAATSLATAYTVSVRASLLVPFLACLAIGCSDHGPSTPTSVLTNYEGVWNRSWTWQECHYSSYGQLSGALCLSPGIRSALRLTLVQVGDTVHGSLVFGEFTTSASGRVGTDRTLSLTAHGQSDDGAVSVTTWRSIVIEGIMSGAFTYTIQPDAGVGRSVTREASFRDAVRSGS